MRKRIILFGMNIQELIKKLISSGVTETQISEHVNAQGIPCSQATINRIKNGGIKRPNFDLGCAIIEVAKAFGISGDDIAA